ncbi:hypothetical protein WICPIJ_001831 [Wickerhamomyces pijperi]|uniref:Major facilitator superfamily (MFS) profile domain-containing protein n=1 Tax=Wickerhamomyces pijperi TaxID=599730 RepID=A0A9P8QAV1_WICPI|nr:hypothetical protein WICPIJ_001831 [Wickerhamomyces pijperi]
MSNSSASNSVIDQLKPHVSLDENRPTVDPHHKEELAAVTHELYNTHDAKHLEEINKDVDIEHEGVILEDESPDLSWKSIRGYLLTRIPSLLVYHSTSLSELNPIPNLREMSLSNWNYFFMGWVAWFSASFDFFLTSVAATQIAASLNVSTADITWGLSAVLMLRSCGAVIFGVWTDNYSRKWPFITCAFMFMALQMGTGFCKDFHQFLAVRALSGIAMGGTYGTASATSLDDAPLRARSFLSGLFFTAYPFGFVFAAIFWRGFQTLDTKAWQALFWFSSGFPFFLIIWRLCFAETQFFGRLTKAKALMEREAIEKGTYVKPTIMSKIRNFGRMCRTNWVLFVYLILFLTYGNYFTHGSQDLFPTLLRKQLTRSEDKITVMLVVLNLGGCVGSLTSGIAMEVIGRRNAILYCTILVGCMVYPTFMVQTDVAIFIAGFFLYFGVMGIWGAMPIHLSELSPPEARALISGLSYQLGNLASSASSTIETTLADRWPLYNADGSFHSYDYSKVMAVLTGATAIYGFVMVILGPERFHRNLSSPTMNKYMKMAQEEEEQEKKC